MTTATNCAVVKLIMFLVKLNNPAYSTLIDVTFFRYLMQTFACMFFFYVNILNRLTVRRDGVVVRASASQSVDLGFISLVGSYQKTLKNGIHSFPAWRSAHKG